MRSLVGAFCPVCLRDLLEALTDFFPVDLPTVVLPAVVFVGAFAEGRTEDFAGALAEALLPVFFAGVGLACRLMAEAVDAALLFFALVGVAFA